MRKKGKKGELSLNLIIVAVIGLIVLVIVAIIFMQRMGIFGRASNDCETQGGTCSVATACPDGSAKLVTACYTDNKPDTAKVCCKQLV